MRALLLVLGALTVAGACGGEKASPAAAPDSLAARKVDAPEALAFMAAADRGEVEAAQLGARKATDVEVLRFAQMMYREHSRSAREVDNLARRTGVDAQASAPPTALVTPLQTMRRQTSQLLNGAPKGTEFDRAYIDSEIRVHQAVLQSLRRITGGAEQNIAAGIAPGGGVDVGAVGGPAAAPAPPPAPATRSGTAATAGPERIRTATTVYEAAQMMIPWVQGHLERARQIQARLRGGGG